MFWIFLTILLSLLTISFHELGHAWAMWRCGVPIKEISLLGIKLPGVPSLTINRTFKGALAPTAISIHPLLVGAYVSPVEGSMDDLTTKDKAFIYGAGPFVNFVYCLIIFGFLCITYSSGQRMVLGAVCFGFAALLLTFRVFFCRYGVLVVGVLFACLFIAAILASPHGVSGSVGGPVTIVSDMSQIYKQNASVGNQLRASFYISVLVSFMLGTTNALPLPPFDGGQIVRTYLSAWNKKFGNYYTAGGVLLFLMLIWTALSTDVGKLFGH